MLHFQLHGPTPASTRSSARTRRRPIARLVDRCPGAQVGRCGRRVAHLRPAAGLARRAPGLERGRRGRALPDVLTTSRAPCGSLGHNGVAFDGSVADQAWGRVTKIVLPQRRTPRVVCTGANASPLSRWRREPVHAPFVWGNLSAKRRPWHQGSLEDTWRRAQILSGPVPTYRRGRPEWELGSSRPLGSTGTSRPRPRPQALRAPETCLRGSARFSLP